MTVYKKCETCYSISSFTILVAILPEAMSLMFKYSTTSITCAPSNIIRFFLIVGVSLWLFCCCFYTCSYCQQPSFGTSFPHLLYVFIERLSNYYHNRKLTISHAISRHTTICCTAMKAFPETHRIGCYSLFAYDKWI